MGDERRWAARYQFLEQLWRGRNRIVCDRELEGVLHAGVEGPLAVLLAELIPGDGGDARAWVALHNDRRAASFARAHSGTVFVGLDDAVELATEEDWQVALLNLDDTDPGSIEGLLEILSERAEDDPTRSVIVTQTCGHDEDETYEQLAEVVEELFGDGRIYGLTRPGMLAFYDFGPVLELELEGGGEGGGEADAEVGIEVDNTLGTPTPRFEAFIAVVGASLPGEGVTFVELPSPAPDGPREVAAPGTARAETEELAALRAQLAEAQRRGDMHAIERQAQLEQLEQAEDRIANLGDALREARESSGSSAPNRDLSGDRAGVLGGDQARGDGPRLDEVLAREQSLRWELDRLRGELEHVRARPVELLEAEVVSLRAQLDRAEAELDEHDEQLEQLQAGSAEGDAGPAGDIDPDRFHARAESLDDDGPTAAQAREWMQAKAKLEHLLRKLERGGQLSALALHRELSSLRRLL
ncbi:hypothetical protein [Enhygromyxa salina]|uniref:Uncharacterized protein n=1 Tax=Enhygromyxa salina TaxID=215803 RepID=A0A2S9XP04_9BACT|nr:hypothetical protein [Enhygromyxa salina]PRP94583.1 hypothetical protein ENSA7_77520 [Enhygromyxa salina]